VASIFRSAEQDVMRSYKTITDDNIDTMIVKEGNSKYHILGGDEYDYCFDFSPFHEKSSDQLHEYVALPFRGSVTWWSYQVQKENMNAAAKKKKSAYDLPVYSATPLNDTYTEVMKLISFKYIKILIKY